MNQWSQNFALACFVGLKPDEATGKWIQIGSDFCGYDDGRKIVIIPDFYNSLDELRWVDECMTHDQRVNAIRELCIICDREYGSDGICPSDVYSPVEISAMLLSCQPNLRTEAILKSLSLWV